MSIRNLAGIASCPDPGHALAHRPRQAVRVRRRCHRASVGCGPKIGAPARVLKPREQALGPAKGVRPVLRTPQPVITRAKPAPKASGTL